MNEKGKKSLVTIAVVVAAILVSITSLMTIFGAYKEKKDNDNTNTEQSSSAQAVLVLEEQA